MEKPEHTQRCAHTHTHTCVSLALLLSVLVVSQSHITKKIKNFYFLFFPHPVLSEASAAKISFDVLTLSDNKEVVRLVRLINT